MGVYFSDAVQTRAAHVIKYTRLTNTTRRTLGTTSGNNEHLFCDFGTFNKQESGSIIVFQGFIFAWSNGAGAITLNAHINRSHSNYVMNSGGASTAYPCVTYNYTGSGYMKRVDLSGAFSGYSTTGNMTFTVGYRAANGENGNRPMTRINPDGNDEGRLESSMQGSTVSLWEILQ